MTPGEADPQEHPRRRAALAAHALREKLAAAGLLDAFPELRGDVADGRAVVRLGTVDANAAFELARRISGRALAGRPRPVREEAKEKAEGDSGGEDR